MAAKRRWSAKATRESDALDLERGVFTKRSAKAIAQSLKRSGRNLGTFSSLAAARKHERAVQFFKRR